MIDVSGRVQRKDETFTEYLTRHISQNQLLRDDGSVLVVRDLEKNFPCAEENTAFDNVPEFIDERLIKAISAIYYGKRGFNDFKDYDLGARFVNRDRKEVVFLTITPHPLKRNSYSVGVARHKM